MTSRADPETKHMTSCGLFERRPQEATAEKCESERKDTKPAEA